MPQQQTQFIQLIQQHQAIIHKVCMVYMPYEWLRQDLYQEIVLQSYKAFERFKGNSKFSTWLYRVAINTAITFYKKETKIQQTNLAFTPMQHDENVQQKSDALHKAILQLDDVEKSIILLHLENYSNGDIAEIMDITINNVAVKLNRIKTKLTPLTQQQYSLL
jgi:RNA polymerase sigma-70 factor (ECF subfamily)